MRPIRSTFLTAFLWALLSLTSHNSYAQSIFQAKEDLNNQAQAAKGTAQADATSTAPHPDTQPTVILETTDGDTLVTGRIGVKSNNADTNTQLVLTLRSPFDPKASTKEVGFLNLDGLTGGTSASLAFTMQGQLKHVFGSEATLTDLCDQANGEILTKFRKDDPQAHLVKACTEDEIRRDALLDNEVGQKKAEALFAMCQDFNKTRSTGLLAPDGSDLASFPGYSDICGEAALGAARAAGVKSSLRDKAKAKVIEDIIAQTPSGQNPKIPEGKALGAAIDAALPALVKDACVDFNKSRARNRLYLLDHHPDPDTPPLWFGECTIDNLGKAAVRDDLEIKQQAAAQIACQKRLSVPSDLQFITGSTDLNNCFLTTLLDFANKSARPNYWQRKILQAIPVTLWYLTVEGTKIDQTFKYLDKNASFAAKSSNSDSDGVSVNASLFSRGWLFTAGGSHQRRFTASPSSQVCLPIDSTGALSCNQAALAGPKLTTMDLFRAEVKTILGPGGVTFRTIYDNHNSDWEHHLILHFLRNTTGGISGGLDVQYNSNPVASGTSTNKSDHFTARLFAGIKFGLPFLPGNPPTTAP